MADEAKRYPPSQRKLGRLWQAGSTPASPALVGGAVLAITGPLMWVAAPVLLAWMRGGVRAALHAGAQPEVALAAAHDIALRGGLLVAAAGVIALTVAVVAQVVQTGGRPDATPAAPARRETGPPRVDGWRGARAVLLVGLAAVVTTAAVRGVLVRIQTTFDPLDPLGTLRALAGSVGWQLLVMLLAVAALDAVAERAGWIRGAWMTRREVEDEARETEGHPLTRERRAVVSRRRNDA